MASLADVKAVIQAASDAFSAEFAALNTSITSEFTAVDAELAKLQAAGGAATAADLDGLVTAIGTMKTNVATALTGAQAAVDAETTKIAATGTGTGSENPPPPPPPGA